MTYGPLQADCLYTGVSSGPNARYRVWEAFTFIFFIAVAIFNSLLNSALSCFQQFDVSLIYNLVFIIITIGADHVGVRGLNPHKNVCGGPIWHGPHENFTEINVTSAKSTPGTAL